MESLPHSVVAAGYLTINLLSTYLNLILSGWVPFTLVSLLTLLLSTLFVLWNRSSRFHSRAFA